MCNNKYLRDELISGVNEASDDSPEIKGPKLAALARMDWKTAEPLLKDYAVGAAPSTTAVALSLLYEHAAQNNQLAEAGAYRDLLKRGASDPQSPDVARMIAVMALMETDWQGRDEWFLSLFADRGFSEMIGGQRPTTMIDALAMPVSRD